MKFVSVMTSESPGGGEFAAVNMLEALTKRGHQAVLLTNQPAIADGREVKVDRIDLGPKLSRSSYGHLVPRWPRLLATLRRALEREAPYDVLILHFKKEQLLGSLLPKRLRPRLIWAEWGPVPGRCPEDLVGGRTLPPPAAPSSSSPCPPGLGTRFRRRASPVGGSTSSRTPCAWTTPSSPRRDARESARSCDIPADALVVGCVSRFHAKKPNAVAVDAVVSLARNDVHLIMAGEGEDEANLRRHAEPLGDRAHFRPRPEPRSRTSAPRSTSRSSAPAQPRVHRSR